MGMKDKIKFLAVFMTLGTLCFLGLNSKSSVITSIVNSKILADDWNGSEKTSFDHIDIESAASFTYYVDGSPVEVDIDFYSDTTELSNIKIYRKNQDGSLENIEVTGKWQNQQGSTNKEHRISGDFDRYYSGTKTEVVYVVEFTLAVEVNGEVRKLVYTEDYSFSSDNNVCPGKGGSTGGIDVEITGEELESFFSSSLKIVKNVEGMADNTFTFLVTGENFSKTVQVTTVNGTGFIVVGGLKPDQIYTIEEVDIPQGYQVVGNNPVTVTAEKNATVVATITNKGETMIVTGTKNWIDNCDQDGIRPEKIVVRLYADGVEVASKEVTAQDKWTYSFANLPKYKDGKEIEYTIGEDAVEGYITTIDNYNITNTHKPEAIDIVGKKVWQDSNNQDGVRPEKITLRLYVDGEEVRSLEVTAGEGNEWTYAFTNLPKYSCGEEIDYVIKEDAVPGYSTVYDDENEFIIINTHETERVSITGTKTWNDNDNQDGIRPDKITVNLYNGTTLVKSLEVTAADNWTYSFEDLPKYEEGKEIVYTITEGAVAGYSTEINNFDIVNTHKPEVIAITGTKTWNDNDNQDGIRPDKITVNLYNGTTLVESLEVTAESNWKYSFENLPKYEKGEEIVYTITEEDVLGYETKVDGFDIVNTHEVEKITFKATKIWDDSDNQDGISPQEITVYLKKNGVVIETVKITEENNWTYVFEDLDRYEDGEEIVYTILEETVKGYETSIDLEAVDEDNIISSTIVNTHVAEVITIEGTKTWNDYDDIDRKRPAEIKIDLYKNGEYLQTITVNADDGWKYVVEDLPKYEDGVEIIYTIVEQPVAEYTTTYDGYNIINTHELGKGTGDDGETDEDDGTVLLPPKTGITTTDVDGMMIIGILSILMSSLGAMFVARKLS